MRANQLPPQRGWQWLGEGFRLWRRNPGLVSAAAMCSLLVSTIVGSLPVIGTLLACLAAPVVSLTVIRICHHVARGQRLSQDGLRIARPRLIGLLSLGALLYAALIGGDLLKQLIAGDALEKLMETARMTGEPPASVPSSVLLGSMVFLLVASLAGSLMWFAPMLTGLRNLSPMKALFFTVVAGWRNKMAFLVFGLGLMVVCIPLSLLLTMGSFGQSLGLMLILGVLWPVVNAVNYLSLIDIFGDLFQPDDER